MDLMMQSVEKLLHPDVQYSGITLLMLYVNICGMHDHQHQQNKYSYNKLRYHLEKQINTENLMSVCGLISLFHHLWFFTVHVHTSACDTLMHGADKTLW